MPNFASKDRTCLLYTSYTKRGNKWVFGGEYLLKNNPYKNTKIPVAQFTAAVSYTHLDVYKRQL